MVRKSNLLTLIQQMFIMGISKCMALLALRQSTKPNGWTLGSHKAYPAMQECRHYVTLVPT